MVRTTYRVSGASHRARTSRCPDRSLEMTYKGPAKCGWIGSGLHHPELIGDERGDAIAMNLAERKISGSRCPLSIQRWMIGVTSVMRLWITAAFGGH